MKTTSSQRGLRWGALLLLAALPATPAYARTHHTATHHSGSHHGESWARDHFAGAERMREALNGRPPVDRTRRDYQRVINAYRNVYYGAPNSSKADASVVAVAETLVEMGRRFDDDKILNEAIGQYRFLRREYPGSKYRCDALFTIGEIYSDDLNNPEQARATFQEFLNRYPHNRLVEDAQQAIAELDRQTEATKNAEAESIAGAEKRTVEAAKNSGTEKRPSQAEKKAGKQRPDNDRADKDDTDSPAEDADAHASTPQEASGHDSGHPSAGLPRVTGIRHWSTPDYTRVAIDLESEVKFWSQRIDNPDRIFFDLRDTKLASTLVGKSFDVDDGFLKKIRVAQFQPGRTRVVLEVDDLSDYDAFLLPNPYRLIIDIHGKNKDKAKNARVRESKVPPESGAGGTEPVENEDSQEVQSKIESKKEDLRSKVGKAPVNRQDVGDDVTVTPNSDPWGLKTPSQSGSAQAAVAKANSREVKAVTKVVVDADDDDEVPPVTAAQRKHPVSATTASGKKGNRSTDRELPADDKLASADRTRTTRPHGKSSPQPNKDADESADIREASPTARGDRSLIRALGLKIGKIVIDPGHGGHDTGTIGPNGLEEKDLVLEVGRRLGKLLETRLGAEVVYTRKNDTFIPLETRTAIANQQRADLFISIHANSSQDPAARGVETYYLNFTSSPEALEVAARENAVSEKSIYELQDLVKKIALKEKIEESREFAGDVQESLHSGLAVKSPGIRNRGVKKAPFIVLIGANMPSILAEISFVSNPGDEHRLETSEYRQRIAESLYRGIAKYVNGLSGVKVASKMEKVAGQ
ncbi:MAG TPA: N-acetylmuramoyl-L-alanine amidase [Candidatus Sulfotelmatobacter sp.]|nr:N-acetylmuramoyl-L-alanine amidase [Candidatus Sulfotelmatobacter sp.]